MIKPTLLILAAGMGSRYGGLKQLDPLGPSGETIMDYSVYDAVKAGFGKVVFVIRKDFEDDFRAKVLSKYQDIIPTEVVFQSIDTLPEGYVCPSDRTKPWGTNHAIMMGAGVINEPFAVINADDYYGTDAFSVMAAELQKPRSRRGDYCMVGFNVGNTMTENGTVSRGVCTPDADGNLASIVERTAIAFDDQHRVYFTNADGSRSYIDFDTPVSMNLWGFTPDYFEYSDREFRKFLDANLNTPKSEYYIPSAVDTLVKSGEATVKILPTSSKWIGVTYAADRDNVVKALAALHEAGQYPTPLLDGLR